MSDPNALTLDMLINYSDTVAIGHMYGVEGKDIYTNRAADRGGKTRSGITEDTAKTYKHLWAKHNFNGNMETLPLSLAAEIYKIGFWDRLKLTQVCTIDKALAHRLFDIAVNKGPGYAAEYIQRILNVLNNKANLYPDLNVDSDFGNKTFQALELFVKARKHKGIVNLTRLITSLQEVSYVTLSEKQELQEENMMGWANRTTDVQEVYHAYWRQKK